MRNIIVVLGVLAGSLVGASVHAQEFRHYGVGQIGTSLVSQQGSNGTAVFGIDFGQDLNSNVQVYLAGGWLQYRDAWHVTSGVKVLLPTSRVRPYVRSGIGAIDYHLGDPNADTRFLAEFGGGVAFEVGLQGHIDVSYRYVFQPYDSPKNGLGGLYMGFGFRY